MFQCHVWDVIVTVLLEWREICARNADNIKSGKGITRLLWWDVSFILDYDTANYNCQCGLVCKHWVHVQRIYMQFRDK